MSSSMYQAFQLELKTNDSATVNPVLFKKLPQELKDNIFGLCTIPRFSVEFITHLKKHRRNHPAEVLLYRALQICEQLGEEYYWSIINAHFNEAPMWVELARKGGRRAPVNFGVDAGTFEEHTVFLARVTKLEIRTTGLNLETSVHAYVRKVEELVSKCPKLTGLTVNFDNDNMHSALVQKVKDGLVQVGAKVKVAYVEKDFGLYERLFAGEQ
ncbi:hypothetical protein LTR37_001452 [Vermiconidia calcicola]|uniref:Uncharacterized protein n=1 Tax=Vermiconidia calcicola TaxID=1690605 RepID=A0ACC3NVL6_9PEZI|nr:hypothetical protein LTR37_001452 [Vermiconidia calcicola]